MAQYRLDRISEEIRKSLDQIIRETVHDPRVTGTFSITRVETAKDLRNAKVFISLLENEQMPGMMQALKGAGGFLRHELGKRLSLRYVPELQFIADHNIEYGIHIAGVLKQVIKQEDASTDEE